MRPDNYYSIQEQRNHNRKERKEKELKAHWEDVVANDFSKVIWSVVSLTVGMLVVTIILL